MSELFRHLEPLPAVLIVGPEQAEEPTAITAVTEALITAVMQPDGHMIPDCTAA